MIEAQGALFDIGKPDVCRKRHKGNTESENANESIHTSKVIISERILKLIRKSGSKGMTCEEIELKLRMKHQTISARCAELRNDKSVTVSGKRNTLSGRPAAVLIITNGK